MLKRTIVQEPTPALQPHAWPPAAAFSELSAEFSAFLAKNWQDKQAHLIRLRSDLEPQGQFIHDSLSVIYSYIYGYQDSPLCARTDTAVEIALFEAKLVLEDELIGRWLPTVEVPSFDIPRDGLSYLRQLAADNPGIHHRLFDFLAGQVEERAMVEFLRCEVARNEVVDDEVALLVLGLQGALKQVATSNLWDECGNGHLSGFHTYWLRRLIDHLRDWDLLPDYRRHRKPWFASITSNSFNALLTRPAYKLRSYGHFLITEAWVDAHFQTQLEGMHRLGLDHEDLTVYFEAHRVIDPHHTEELIGGLERQCPELTREEVQEVIRGAHQAIAAAVAQYDRLYLHLGGRVTDAKVGGIHK